ncbi:MAG TPA: MFS transporter [Beijerinckiaceae bacterium]|jgi:predicted MFS family arabinose efflux permease
MSTPPPDPLQARGFGLILILGTATFASTYSARTAEPLVGLIARDLRSTTETIALVTTAFALPYAFIQPILGPVGDSLGKERVIIVSLGVMVAALVASAFADDAATLLALRVVAGAAAGGIIPAALATVGDRIDMARRQVAVSRLMMAVVVGQLCGSSISGLLAQWIGWRGVFLLAGAVALCAGVAMLATFGLAARARSRLSVRGAVARYREIIAIGRARALFAFVFIEAITIYGIFPYIAPIFEERQLGGPFEAGVVLASFGVGGLLYALLVRQMMRLGLKRLLVGGGIVVALASLILALARDWRIDIVAMIMSGFGFYMLHNPFQTQVTEVAPHSRASAVSLHAFSFFSGQALGVVVIGFALRSIGLLGTMALCALTILAMSLVAASILTSPPTKPATS